MSRIFVCLVISVFSAGNAHVGAAPQITTRTVTAEVRIASRTSLIVSNHVLQFSVPHPGPPAVSTVHFVAGVRTHTGGEVVLTVEAYAAEPRLQDARLTFSGHGDARLQGTVMGPGAAIAGRWVGSGRRTGQVEFALHGVSAGTYTIPVRFVLSAP